MATPREIRRLAFQVLYQLDLRGSGDLQSVQESLEGAEGFTPAERRKGFELGRAAYEARAAADADMVKLAPAWPAHRQAAVDRAILRLAHYEMMSGKTHPKIAVNEAVELAKEFSTDRSPAFVNGLLDKILKQVLAAGTAKADSTDPAPEVHIQPQADPTATPPPAP